MTQTNDITIILRQNITWLLGNIQQFNTVKSAEYSRVLTSDWMKLQRIPEKVFCFFFVFSQSRGPGTLMLLADQ